MQALTWITMAYFSYYYTVKDGLNYWKVNCVKTIRICIEFHYLCFIYVVLDLIHARYKTLAKLCYIQFVKNEQIFSIQLENLICILKKVVNLFNNYFGWALFLTFMYRTPLILYTLNFVFSIDESEKSGTEKLIFGGITAIASAPLISIILKCGNITEQFQNIQSILDQARTLGDEKRLRKLDSFTDLLQNNRPHFTAARFFTIEKATILTILGTITTFIIILIQFNSEDCSCSCTET